MLPLCKPALVALGVFTFREAWDMYIWPLIIVSKDSLRTLPLGISLFMSSYGTAWDQLMAIAVLGTLPMIVLFFVLQRAFIQGIAVTGLEGVSACPDTMRAVVIARYGGSLELMRRPMPQPGYGEVLVQVHASGLCSTDLHLLSGRQNLGNLPRIIGHELAGEVVESATASRNGARAIA